MNIEEIKLSCGENAFQTAEIEKNDLENSLQDRAVKIITAGENDSLYKLIFNKDSITKSYY